VAQVAGQAKRAAGSAGQGGPMHARGAAAGSADRRASRESVSADNARPRYTAGVAAAITIRELGIDERTWADERYRAIGFAESPAGALALVAERAGRRVGLGRLVEHARGVVELGGIWTDETARGAGVARAMVTALLGRVEVAAALPAVAAGPEGAALLWCIPFRHLLAFYQSFGFTDAALPWPAPIARKAAALIAQEQAIAVLALHRRHGRQVDPAAGDGAVAA